MNGRFVANLDIDSNVDGIVKGKGLATGVIEFSPWDYAGGNPRNVPNASTAFDFGDQLHVRAGNFACMQVANFAADLGNSSTGQIVWALGRFNGRGVCVGIGNCPNTTDIDYTWANNAGNYKSRTLYVLVKPDDEADENDDYVPMHAVASSDGRQVAVSFASAVRATAAQPRYFSIGGVGVTDAEVSSIDARHHPHARFAARTRFGIYRCDVVPAVNQQNAGIQYDPCASYGTHVGRGGNRRLHVALRFDDTILLAHSKRWRRLPYG